MKISVNRRELNKALVKFKDIMLIGRVQTPTWNDFRDIVSQTETLSSGGGWGEKHREMASLETETFTVAFRKAGMYE